jgi:LPS-assembly lipoprotein
LNIKTQLLVIIFSVLWLTGCGFHLRGNTQFTEQFNPLMIDSSDLKPAQLQLIKNSLIQANARLAIAEPLANKLKVSFKTLRRQKVASSRVSEVELIRISMQINYRINSPTLDVLTENKIVQSREIELDSSNVLSHQGLVDKGLKDLEQSLVRSMIYQLKQE